MRLFFCDIPLKSTEVLMVVIQLTLDDIANLAVKLVTCG